MLSKVYIVRPQMTASWLRTVSDFYLKKRTGPGFREDLGRKAREGKEKRKKKECSVLYLGWRRRGCKMGMCRKHIVSADVARNSNVMSPEIHV